MNLFFVFLGTAAWQDLRTRSISLEVLAGGAAVGIITCIWKERLPGEIVLAMIRRAAAENDVVVLAQGSMTVLLPLLKDIPVPVLSSPRLCVERVKELLEAQG